MAWPKGVRAVKGQTTFLSLIQLTQGGTMSALDDFLALMPGERVEAVLKAKDDFPSDPHPAMRCVAADPLATFPTIEEEVADEIRSYIRLLTHFGHIDPSDIESVARAGELYILALSIMRIQAS